MLQAARAAEQSEPAQISRKWGCTLAKKWNGGRTQLPRMLPGECPEFLLALAGTLWESARTQSRVSKDHQLLSIMGRHDGSGHTVFEGRVQLYACQSLHGICSAGQSRGDLGNGVKWGSTHGITALQWTVFWGCGKGHVYPSCHLLSLLAHTQKLELNWILPVDFQTRKRPGSTGECPVAQLGRQGAYLPAVWPTHPSEPLCSHECSPRTWPNVSQRAGSPRRPMAVGGFAAAPDCFTFVRCRNW